ncbi:helix-turn-helix transcriptional regulator [Erysipelothrix sp. HDW6C]|uniref:PadR family transcriptional regulator n=1 Tax=Erysipelothrix sp. HDW6C TaxID=2714930 RepID=UPI00140D1038|nr:PadR family transcriptional regulator [Erysipelothrix sp. HDW6C]QIK70742.1 helix-turn-helix transcriptional regulator [Erysipelothrix sp. HDW6C]
MISSDVIRGYNDTIVLFLLLDGDSYGYEIGQEIKALSHGKYTIKETTLYSTFTRLEKNGYITSYEGDETRGRARTYYHITESGRSYYKEKQVEWGIVKEVIDVFTKEKDNETNS